MSKSTLGRRTRKQDAGVLKTEVLSEDQTAALTQIVEVSLEQLDGVGGGLTTVAMDPCHCCHPH